MNWCLSFYKHNINFPLRPSDHPTKTLRTLFLVASSTLHFATRSRSALLGPGCDVRDAKRVRYTRCARRDQHTKGVVNRDKNWFFERSARSSYQVPGLTYARHRLAQRRPRSWREGLFVEAFTYGGIPRVRIHSPFLTHLISADSDEQCR